MQYSLFFLVWTALSTLSTALSAPNQGETRFSVDPTTADKRGRSCDCYSVSGSDPGHFQHHKFWDFRQVPLNALAVKDFQFQPVTQADASAIHQNKDFNAAPILLKDTPFAADWLIQDWQRSGSLLFPIPIANSNKNAFLTRSLAGGTSFLAMRTKRFEKYSSTAEIETGIQNFMHVSFRVRLRILGNDEPILSPPLLENNAFGKRNDEMTDMRIQEDPLAQRIAARLPPSTGACVGIFTFFSRTSESDIEILTSDPPNRAHYANQPDYDPIRNVVIPGSQVAVDSHVPWTTWSTYRLDWFPGMSRWYVENQLQASLAYGIPVDPSRLIVNIWSDGGLWSGNLTVGNSVHLGIEWIEIAYNLTGEAPQPCNTVCRIDNVAHPGVPEM
ncbi:hypothetical protein EYB25_000192 [Talaromyces marneffei]|uniref:Endo-1,3(4)-beta-glucanase, putative n=1 Tax=Talaromyces marneffei (strain ATCC 18224 / CBS 334.59 / QM 7333) TaxID=441960 RepID=B6Q1P2_TALMQ|nr:uncharacterized protein EYB26_002161 [Talaromyces marneffei]EEA28895.1 endo-1,3(4)-beta-glucanase, putative [Talaromyces marneffei ATCC 18224]KAE8555496.1 hypothetical protein EYB25_000192 [Talaromyces marneffei]QGA14506.1 hypothetical protein EYB26_002161 [Talaromyces marneffei]